MSKNPLANYFRKPSIYITLPSKGEFYPDGTLEMPENNELPIYPMTAADEIAYKTPDALFNGSAVVDVIESCVPNIKDAWKIPNIDLDSILSAIRIASYGHTIDVDTTCPKCDEEASYGLDLRSIMTNLKTPDYSTPVEIGDLSIFLKPMSYKDINENSIAQFEEQKLSSILEQTDIPEEEKLKLLSEAFRKVTNLTIISMKLSIAYIKTPDTVVSDADQIKEFLNNCERAVFEKIKDSIVSLREVNEIKPLDITCNDCDHNYKQPFTMDMTSFFA